ncbi:MAG: PHP domain-containing protein [Candidatus Alcyoniella australis]|nr:PHP domain-containing protein [Candidatus Alcyoniella australis]
MIDLHIHTSHSADAEHPPQRIFQMAAQIGLHSIAFADHDSAAGLEQGEQLSAEYGIEFIPGIELSTTHDQTDLHLLGYMMHWRSDSFRAWLMQIHAEKMRQARQILQRLQELGFAVQMHKVEAQAKGMAPTGSCFLLAMFEEPDNNNDPRLAPYRPGGARSDSPFLNFYLDYMAAGKPAFVPLPGVGTAEAIVRLRQAGGVPVLAHPNRTQIKVVDELVEEGLMGIEAFSTYHDSETNRHWLDVAYNRHLIVTAGSDFHGRRFKPEIELGGVEGNDDALLAPLKRMAQRLIQ